MHLVIRPKEFRIDFIGLQKSYQERIFETLSLMKGIIPAEFSINMTNNRDEFSA